jgi:hypothetical protein
MVEILVTTTLLGFLLVVGLISGFLTPIIIIFWGWRKRKRIKSRIAEPRGLVEDQALMVLSSPGYKKFAGIVYGACLEILGVCLVVPLIGALSGHSITEDFYLDVVPFTSLLLYFAAVYLIPWIPAVMVLGRTIIITNEGIVESVPFKKVLTIGWIEISSADLHHSNAGITHFISAGDRHIGFNWETSGFWDFMKIVKEKVPDSVVRKDKKFSLPGAPKWYQDWIGYTEFKKEAPPHREPGPKIKKITAWLSKIADILRVHRDLVLYSGLILLSSGIILILTGVVLENEIVKTVGIALPIVGLFLTLVSFVVEKFRKSKETHKDAENEAFFGYLIYAYFGLCVTVLILMMPTVLDNLEGKQSSLYVITPVVTTVYVLQGLPLMLYFIFIVIAIILSFIVITRDGLMNYVKVMRGEEVPEDCGDDNPMFGNVISEIFYMFLAMLFFSIAVFIVVRLMGINPIIPVGDEEIWVSVYSNSRAAVWEEIVSRVLLLGIPLFFIDGIFRRGNLAKPLKYFIGGINRFGKIECGLVLFSGFMFGLAHIGAWDIYKVLPSTVAGLFFGYLFLKFGIYAAIMLHFLTDFYSIPQRLMGEEFEVLPVVFIIFGFVAFWYYSREMIRFVKHNLMKKPLRATMVHAVTGDALSTSMSKQERKNLRKQFRKE